MHIVVVLKKIPNIRICCAFSVFSLKEQDKTSCLQRELDMLTRLINPLALLRHYLQQMLPRNSCRGLLASSLQQRNWNWGGWIKRGPRTENTQYLFFCLRPIHFNENYSSKQLRPQATPVLQPGCPDSNGRVVYKRISWNNIKCEYNQQVFENRVGQGAQSNCECQLWMFLAGNTQMSLMGCTVRDLLFWPAWFGVVEIESVWHVSWIRAEGSRFGEDQLPKKDMKIIF